MADGYFEWPAPAGPSSRTCSGSPAANRSGSPACGSGGRTSRAGPILTTAANPLSRPIHARMPVILPRDAYDVWLDDAIDDAGALAELLRPYPAEAMECYAVSRDVGSPKNNRPDLLTPLPA